MQNLLLSSSIQFGHNKVKNPEAMIEAFSDVADNPVIAVSVDMLDTGIDVPEVVNLVFFKPVKSKSKFWQMIGRGTRLCPDLFGPGMDKDHFRIFDFCQNFDFFDVNGDGFESAMGESLVQRMFKARVRLAFYLQGVEYQEQEGTKALWQETVDWLHEQINHIETDSALVRKFRKKLNQFREKSELSNLNESKVNDLIKELSQLPFPVINEEEMKKRFDVKALNLMLAIIENKPIQKKYIQEIQKTADDLLKKSSLPSVQKRLELLKRIKEKEFWKAITIDGVEKVRVELRDLIKLLDKEDNSQ
jgi:type I restriction enzyme, R subunit